MMTNQTPLQVQKREELLKALKWIRSRLEIGFRPDTAAAGFPGTTPSAGHCAAVSAIVARLFGGDLVSSRVDGLSHWYNRFYLESETVDCDITGDQFGHAPIQISDPGNIYSDACVRDWRELNLETLKRAILLAERSGITEAAKLLSGSP